MIKSLNAEDDGHERPTEGVLIVGHAGTEPSPGSAARINPLSLEGGRRRRRRYIERVDY